MNAISFGNVSGIFQSAICAEAQIRKNLATAWGISMFGRNKKEEVTIVTTKEQLKAAVHRKDTCIEVRGDLAKKMKWMAKLSKKKAALVIAVLTGAAVAAPAAGGAAVAVAGITSADIAIVAVLGVAVIAAILNGYDIEFKTTSGTLRLTKNK